MELWIENIQLVRTGTYLHLIFIFGFHLIFIWCSFDVHLMFIWSSFDLRLIFAKVNKSSRYDYRRCSMMLLRCMKLLRTEDRFIWSSFDLRLTFIWSSPKSLNLQDMTIGDDLWCYWGVWSYWESPVHLGGTSEQINLFCLNFATVWWHFEGNEILRMNL